MGKVAAESGQGKIFGTDGIRDIVGVGYLKKAFLEKLGRVIGRKLGDDHGNINVLIGRDTRPSGVKIEKIIAQALVSVGVDVDSAGVISTPGLAYLTKLRKYAMGIMISASHNPSDYNGIKLFASNGLKLKPAMEAGIEKQLRAGFRPRRHRIKPGTFPALVKSELTGQYIINLPRVILGPDHRIFSPATKIIVDCANGALSGIAPEVFRATGATVIPINAEAKGENINRHCGSLYPEALRRKVLAVRAHIGFSFDGDGDRVIMVDEKGHIRDGDFVLYMASKYLKPRGLLKNHTVVGTVMTNSALDNALIKQGIKVVRTKVGDKYVLEEMLKSGFSIGGEPSGHIIFRDYSKNGDGLITALVMLKIITAEKKTLSELAKGFVQYPQIIVNVPVKSKPPLEDIKPIQDEAARVRNILHNHGRLVLRYSGTENLCRVMIEGKSFPHIKALAGKLADVIKNKLG